MKSIALIPARGGSKGIHRKNIKLFNSKPLIYWSIQAALNSDYIDRVIVSTEDEEIAEIAESFSAEVPFLRPKELATDKASSFSVLDHAVQWLSKYENWVPDIIVLLQPTTPFRRGYHIDGVIKLLLDTEADAAITVRKPDYPPYWMLEMDSKKRFHRKIY